MNLMHRVSLSIWWNLDASFRWDPQPILFSSFRIPVWAVRSTNARSKKKKNRAKSQPSKAPALDLYRPRVDYSRLKKRTASRSPTTIYTPTTPSVFSRRNPVPFESHCFCLTKVRFFAVILYVHFALCVVWWLIFFWGLVGFISFDCVCLWGKTVGFCFV